MTMEWIQDSSELPVEYLSSLVKTEMLLSAEPVSRLALKPSVSPRFCVDGWCMHSPEGCLSCQLGFLPPGMHVRAVEYKYVQADNRKLCYDSSLQLYGFILTCA